MNRDRIHFLFLNVGHFLDHMFTLIFATVAALALIPRVGLELRRPAEIRDARLLRLRLFSLPAGWLADKWSREGMVAVFFVGIGAVLDRHGVRADAAAGRHRAVLDRRVRRDLSSGRPRHRHAAMEEHRHADRRERRVGQSRRRQRRAHHRLFHRSRRLARRLHCAGHVLHRGGHALRSRTSGRRSCTATRSRAEKPAAGGPHAPATTRRCCCAFR